MLQFVDKAIKSGGDVFILDGDLLAYRAAFTAQKREIIQDLTREDLPPTAVERCDLEVVRSYIDEHVSESIPKPSKSVKAKKAFVVLALSSERNFRRQKFPEYKANRKSEKPLGLDWARGYIEGKYQTEIVDGLEADDVLGLYATHPDLKDRVVCVSDDKDMLTLPGFHAPFKGGAKADWTYVEPGEAIWAHYSQTITGDACDGYKGVPGAGPAAAVRALGEKSKDFDPIEGWKAVLRLYWAKGLTETDAVRNAQMAKILWWDQVKNYPEIRMWMPPS